VEGGKAVTDAQLQQIKTIIVVMMENRSFDHMLGHLSLPQFGGLNVEGIRQALDQNYRNIDPRGITYISPTPISADWNAPHDPPHERQFVNTALTRGIGTPPYLMGGFVQAYYDANGYSYEPNVAGYYTAEQVPVLDFLAKTFGICDRWFAPIPTSTQPNRLMALAGYTTIDATGGYPMPDHKLVYDWLVGKASWRVYSESHPFIMIMERWTFRTEFDKDHFRPLERLKDDVESGDLPDVIFIEPTYSDDFPRPSNPSDQHWPCSIKAGESFLQRVYESLFCGVGAIATNLWKDCVMFVTYDEHGGYADHVPPALVSTAVADGGAYAPFATTGVRVPAVVISPFVKTGSIFPGAGSVDPVPFDHTSILKLIIQKFGLSGSTPEIRRIEARLVRSAGDLLNNFDAPIVQAPPLPPSIDALVTSLPNASAWHVTPNAKAFQGATQKVWQAFPEHVEQSIPHAVELLHRIG
jgi:phospholipase C